MRAVAPIPGNNTFGVTAPNSIRDSVRLLDLIEEGHDRAVRRAIPLFLGKDAIGEAIIEDLAAMPHMLIAGGRSADCYLQADARVGVEELEKLLAKRNFKSTGYRTPDVKQKLVNHNADRTEFELEPGPVAPREGAMSPAQPPPPRGPTRHPP
mgnify:CR=1 FL=1